MKEYIEFEELVKNIFIDNGYAIGDENRALRTKDGSELEVDFSIVENQKRYVVEVKYYRNNITANYYDMTVKHLRTKIVKLNFDHGVLVTSSAMIKALKKEIESIGIVVIDQFELVNMAAGSVELSEKLASMLSDRRAQKTPSSIKIESIASKLKNAQSSPPSIPLSILNQTPERKDYCRELSLIKPGRAEFSKYEKKCVEILQYLFNAHLTGWKTQQRTDDELNRFDLVTRIRSESDFWKFLCRELGSRYMIFEFKNYKDKIKQGEVLTTEKYLHKTSLRTVAFLISRVGASDNAIKFAQGAMREHGKLIIVLNDDELCKMITMKDQGDDPSEYLFDKIDDFLMCLPR